MWKDPIVEETRRLREQYSATLNHDTNAIYEDLQKRQALSAQKSVSFPPRQPVKTTTPA